MPLLVLDLDNTLIDRDAAFRSAVADASRCNRSCAAGRWSARLDVTFGNPASSRMPRGHARAGSPLRNTSRRTSRRANCSPKLSSSSG